MKNDATTSWITKGRNFQTSKMCKTTFILKEFFENKSIKWNLHVDSTPGPHRYDMILGHNVLSKLGITLNFKDQTMTWDDSTISMKDPESLADLLDPINDFFRDTPQNLRKREFGQNFIDHNCDSLKVKFHKIHIPDSSRQLPTSPDKSRQTPNKSRQAQRTSTDSSWRNMYHKMTFFHVAMAAALIHFFISPKPPTAKL